MRPTDENQHGSTRPNLMSPSRSGGADDNILAMLERDAGRGRPGQFSSHRRMGWYAGAGALVVAMVGALGWLAWENATKERELSLDSTHVVAVADPHPDAAQPLPAHEASAPVEAAPAAPATTAPMQAGNSRFEAAAIASVQPESPAQPGAGAAIIDSPAVPAEAPALQLAQASTAAPAMPPARARAADATGLPPLVLLPPEEAGPKRATPAPAAPPAKSSAAAAMPPKAAAAATAKTDAAPPPRAAAKAGAASAPRSIAKAGGAPASRPAAKAAQRTPARPPRARAKTASAAAAPAQAKSHDASTDSDVALISAIIMHSSKHAAERAKAEAAKSCEGSKCAAKQ